MNKRLYFFGGLALAVAAVAVLTIQTHLQAQALSKSPSYVVIEEAVALLDQGEPEAARVLLAAIDPSDPEYPLAKGYDAVCLYRTDRLKFYRAIQSPEMQTFEWPPELREELDYDQIDTLYYYCRFEEILPKIREFADWHGDSPKLAAVAEYQMATLYERGMKKIYEGCASQDTNVFKKRYEDGRSNLVDFVDVVVSLNQADYLFLPKRSLQEEIWKAQNLREQLWMAQIALGNETELGTAIPYADRERAAFLSLELHQKLQPQAADDNLRRMTDFLNDFPYTKYRKRVEFEMADIALCEGERLASKARRAGNAETAAAKRATAAPYLDRAHDLFSGVVEHQEEEVGIAEADVKESREGMLRVFFAQEDWAGLSDWAAQLITNSPVEKEWLVTKLYEGAGLCRQGKMTEAASVLDEVLAIGFRNHPSYDGFLVSAAGWRIRVARETGDEATQQRVAQLVQSSDCYNSFKRTFVKNFGELLAAQPAPVSR